MSEIISNKKVVFRWAMYDWANSVYNLVITSTIFPAYFLIVTSNNDQNITNNTVRVLGRTFLNTALYNYLLGFAFIIVAILLPVLSSIADVYGNKKRFLRFFCIVGSVACCFLFFFDSEHKNVGYICLIIACIAYWCSLVFYNAYLIEIVPSPERDKTSALGFTMGYIGSVILQTICFILIIKNDLFNITQGAASKYSFLLVGIWWLGFGLYAINRLPNNIKKQPPITNIFISAYKEIFAVWKILKNNKVVKNFILSFFFFNMGVQTVMLAATIYGKNELNISTDVLMISILLIQLVAIPGSFIIAFLSKKMGNIWALFCCVIVWVFVCIFAFYVPKNNNVLFVCLATIVGFVMGGIQSLSRSTFSKLIPADCFDHTTFFCFFDFTEKIAIIIGMFSFGIINEIFGSQRNSVLSLMLYFIIGGILLIITQKNANKKLIKI